MAAGTLAVLQWALGPEPRLGEATTAGTMAFVTFMFFQVFNLLNVRHDTRSVFSRETLHNRSAFIAVAAVVVLLDSHWSVPARPNQRAGGVDEPGEKAVHAGGPPAGTGPR